MNRAVTRNARSLKLLTKSEGGKADRLVLRRIGVGATALAVALVLPFVESRWNPRSQDTLSFDRHASPGTARPAIQRAVQRATTTASTPRYRDLVLHSGVRAAMSRMAAGY